MMASEREKVIAELVKTYEMVLKPGIATVEATAENAYDLGRKAGIEEERALAAKDVCVNCRSGMAIEHSPTGSVHVRPHLVIGKAYETCFASAIWHRALEEERRGQ